MCFETTVFQKEKRFLLVSYLSKYHSAINGPRLILTAFGVAEWNKSTTKNRDPFLLIWDKH